MPVVPTVLKGEYVRLDPLSFQHLEGLCKVGLDPDLWRWTPRAVRSRSDLAEYVHAALDGHKNGTMLPFAIIERLHGNVVGSTRFGNIDSTNRRLEIGWTWVARSWQRTAVNTETKLLLLGYAFGELSCNRVEFRTDVLNDRSRRAILRLGAKEEGVFRKHLITESGRIRDTICFSIISDEWPAVELRLNHMLKCRSGK